MRIKITSFFSISSGWSYYNPHVAFYWKFNNKNQSLCFPIPEPWVNFTDFLYNYHLTPMQKKLKRKHKHYGAPILWGVRTIAFVQHFKSKHVSDRQARIYYKLPFQQTKVYYLKSSGKNDQNPL